MVSGKLIAFYPTPIKCHDLPYILSDCIFCRAGMAYLWTKGQFGECALRILVKEYLIVRFIVRKVELSAFGIENLSHDDMGGN